MNQGLRGEWLVVVLTCSGQLIAVNDKTNMDTLRGYEFRKIWAFEDAPSEMVNELHAHLKRPANVNN